jgi:hypothetical protein
VSKNNFYQEMPAALSVKNSNANFKKFSSIAHGVVFRVV